MGNVGKYSVSIESVYQTWIGWQNKMSRGCLAGRPYPRDTRETQLFPSVLTLCIPVMCNAHASFRGMLLSLHTLSLSNTQPLHWNSTINTGYKRLNNIQSNLARNESQQNTYLKITTLQGRLRMCLNASRNHISRSSVEAFKSVQEIKQRVQIH